MKTKNTIMAVISTALLLGGTFLLVKDDAQQAQKSAEIKPYALTQDVQDSLDRIADELTAETQTVTSELLDMPETSAVSEISADSAENSEPPEQERRTPDTIPDEIYQQLQDAARNLTDACPDAVGWLYLPDTNINYPLMQGEDNEFYLHHAYDGSHLSAGSVFLDCRCSPNFMNPINVVYAHNMKNGSMFAGLLNFKNSEYFESHRCGWLSTADKVYRIDFFSLAVADWHDSIYDGSQPVSNWMNRIQNLSQIFERISYDENDKFISLSTCSSEFQNARTVLTGRLVEMNRGENDS